MKTLPTNTENSSKGKKIVRAKRSLLLKNFMPVMNNNDVSKSEIILSIENESTIFHHEIKRRKKLHAYEFEAIIKNEIFSKSRESSTFGVDSSSDKLEYEDSIKQQRFSIANIILKKIGSQRCYTYSLFIIGIILYLYLSNLTNINKYNVESKPFVYFQNNIFIFIAQQSIKSIYIISKEIISQYGKFIRSYFFSLLDSFIKLIGEIYFLIDRYEYKDRFFCVITSGYEYIYTKVQ